MSDLISRSALLDVISKMSFDFGNDTDDTETIIEMVNEAINNQPTAYDVEKVVAELESEYDNIPFQYENNYEDGFSDGLLKAIDIVRKGGVE